MLYQVYVEEFGQETPVGDFDSKQEAAKFVVDHKSLFKDDRFFGINEISESITETSRVKKQTNQEWINEYDSAKRI